MKIIRRTWERFQQMLRWAGDDLRRGENLETYIMIVIAIALVCVSFFVDNEQISKFLAPLTLVLLVIITTTNLGLRHQITELLDKPSPDTAVILDEINHKLSNLNINEVIAQQKERHYGGIAVVHEKLPVDVFLEKVRQSQEVTILNTFIPSFHEFEDAIEAAVNRNALVRIFLLFPKSEAVDLRERALQALTKGRVHNVQAQIEDCLDRLGDVYVRLPEGKRENLQVSLYNSLPSVSIYQADDTMYVGVFFHGRLAVKSSQLEIHGLKSRVGAQMFNELEIIDKIASASRIKNLADWRNEVDGMVPRFGA